MPITKSVKKRVRQAEKTNSRNNLLLSKVKKNIKELLVLIEKKDKKNLDNLFKICQKNLSKAGDKGIYKKKKVSRKISSLNSKIKAI